MAENCQFFRLAVLGHHTGGKYQAFGLENKRRLRMVEDVLGKKNKICVFPVNTASAQ